MTSRLQLLKEQTQISIARSGRTISSLNDSFSHIDPMSLPPDRAGYPSGAASSGTGYVDTSSAGRGGHGYPLPPSDLSSASGGAAALQRSEGDALVMQELEELRQQLRSEREARAALERKVAVLLHWKDLCEADVVECKGKVETIDQKMSIDIQRLTSKMSEERSKLSAAIAGISSAASLADVPAAASWDQLQVTNADVAATKRDVRSLAETVSRMSKEQLELRTQFQHTIGEETVQQQQLQYMRSDFDARIKESEAAFSSDLALLNQRVQENQEVLVSVSKRVLDGHIEDLSDRILACAENVAANDSRVQQRLAEFLEIIHTLALKVTDANRSESSEIAQKLQAVSAKLFDLENDVSSLQAAIVPGAAVSLSSDDDE